MSTTSDSEAEMRERAQLRPLFRRDRPSWMAIAAMMLSVMIPVCGWLVTLSNRVAALEVSTQSLATAAQMAEVKQKVDDLVEETIRERVEAGVAAERQAK